MKRDVSKGLGLVKTYKLFGVNGVFNNGILSHLVMVVICNVLLKAGYDRLTCLANIRLLR